MRRRPDGSGRERRRRPDGPSRLPIACLLALAGAVLAVPSDPRTPHPARVHAQPSTPAPTASGTVVLPEDVAAVARELNCPLCQGYTLQDCPLEVCRQMRDLIAVELAAGRTKDEIKAQFVADYGPQVLNSPPPRGFFLAAWVLPFVVLGAGAVALWQFFRRAGRVDRGGTGAGRVDVEPEEGVAAAGGGGPPQRDAEAADYAARLDRMARDEP